MLDQQGHSLLDSPRSSSPRHRVAPPQSHRACAIALQGVRCGLPGADPHQIPARHQPAAIGGIFQSSVLWYRDRAARVSWRTPSVKTWPARELNRGHPLLKTSGAPWQRPSNSQATNPQHDLGRHSRGHQTQGGPRCDLKSVRQLPMLRMMTINQGKYGPVPFFAWTLFVCGRPHLRIRGRAGAWKDGGDAVLQVGGRTRTACGSPTPPVGGVRCRRRVDRG